jgi:dTDP-glucose 4,6-dehydratase
LHIDDFCTGIDTILHGRKRDVEAEVFNLGSGHQRAHFEVVELLLHFMDRSPRLIQLSDKTEHLGKQIPVDTSKIERLGWRPGSDFNKGLTQTIQWYEENVGWWEKLRHPSHIQPALMLDDE